MTRRDRGLDPFMPGRPVGPEFHPLDVFAAPAELPAGADPAAYRVGRCGRCGGEAWLRRASVATWSRLPIICTGCEPT